VPRSAEVSVVWKPQQAITSPASFKFDPPSQNRWGSSCRWPRWCGVDWNSALVQAAPRAVRRFPRALVVGRRSAHPAAVQQATKLTQPRIRRIEGSARVRHALLRPELLGNCSESRPERSIQIRSISSLAPAQVKPHMRYAVANANSSQNKLPQTHMRALTQAHTPTHHISPCPPSTSFF
jgi:hypothetical protein